MKSLLNLILIILFSIPSLAQKTAADSWLNVPKSPDDRYTNPKSAVYAGPNGWWNFGEVRAEGVNSAALKYTFKGGLTTNSEVFILTESGKLQLFSMDFGTDEPALGVYQISKKEDKAAKKVKVSFSDVANKKIKNWSGADGAGTITVSKSGDFLYFKCRNVTLQPDGMSNEGDSKQPLKIGFEGAAKL
ncbi:hypothetical protein [Dyadobacter psychrotolerans]|uniref:Uncharacterized protein n=1 Tax=Dyadobacter psychrotolerans TaxID=2541721 RepID=A0A4R5DPE8_9BACT|nr:hypothetical protein [Dyadobacter psychrotolerans]TDE12825.1 hypothetical protein E0F88_20990 [Dyadobacter psychrotolerans]